VLLASVKEIMSLLIYWRAQRYKIIFGFTKQMAQAWHDVVGIKFLMDSGGCGQPDLGSTEL